MDTESRVNEFVRRAREANESNIESVILYGSAVSGDYHPQFSNLNLFCVLRDSSITALRALAPVARWWNRQKQPPPLLMSRQELERSTDVFTIELLDMQQHHRLLFGVDVLQSLQIPMHRHRVQVEYELREKQILLRQQSLLASEKDSRLWELLMRSVPSFLTLFRHALIALGDTSRMGNREAVQVLAKLVGFDPSAINPVLDVREGKADPKKMDAKDIFARYLGAIDKVTVTVDQALDSEKSGHA